jgi:para-aminobenzoate synthetase component 1
MLPLRYQTIPFESPRPVPELLQIALRQPFCVFFDSADGSGDSWLSFAPVMLLQCTGHSALFQRGKHASRLEGDPLEVFERVERFTHQECPLPEPPGAPGFCGGWAGLWGFDLRASIEKLPPPKPGGPLFPDLQAGFYPWVLRLPARGQPELRLLAGAPGGPDDIEWLAGDLWGLFEKPLPEPRPQSLGAPVLSTGREQFVRDIQTVRGHIRAGDIYQANLTREVVYSGSTDAAELYLRLRSRNPAPFAGFLDCGDGRAVLSSSPECFLHVAGGTVTTRPIKGTRPRDADPAVDARLRDELANSEKDRAELTMIVDLERNDLSRVCVPGTVRVPVLHGLHSFARVHHLEATVQGSLRPEVTPAELIRAVFPGGSISGCPKKRALEIIHELEPVRRGPYTGSLFWLAPGGDMQASILIRTLLVEPGRVSFHVGGGITWASDPQAEWDETRAKGAALHDVLEAR